VERRSEVGQKKHTFHFAFIFLGASTTIEQLSPFPLARVYSAPETSGSVLLVKGKK
jgi:hypothetical protein